MCYNIPSDKAIPPYQKSSLKGTKMLLTNAFSLNMLARFPAQPTIEEITVEEVRELLHGGFESAVGHADTAVLFAEALGFSVPCNRISVSFENEGMAVIGQYRGPRLPEGCHTLPEGASILWLLLRVSYPS